MISLNSVLQSLKPYLDRYAKAKCDWGEIEKCMWMIGHRRFRFEDFSLGCKPSEIWQFYPSRGVMQLAKLTFCGLHDSVPIRERVQALRALLSTQEACFHSAVQRFLANLHHDVLTAIRSDSIEAPISDYNRFFSDRKESARYRAQAARVAPLLGIALCNSGVDAGRPLWPLHSKKLGVPEEVIRWAGGKTIDDVGILWAGHVRELLQLLAKIPPEKRPNDDKAWAAFTAFVRPWIGRSLDMKESWLHDLARIGWVTALRQVGAMHAMPADIADIRDLVEEAIKAISQELRPEHRQRRLQNAVKSAFSEFSVLRQLRASLRWHQLQRVADADAVNHDDDPGNNWLAPIDQPLGLEHGGLTAHFLTTQSQLENEGRRMQHCVGYYATSCLCFNVSIVSFRDSEGRSVSTAELQLEKRERRFVFAVRQHCGFENGGPSSEAEAALNVLLQVLSADALQQRLRQMFEQCQERKSDQSRLDWERLITPRRVQMVKEALGRHVDYGRLLGAARNVLAAEQENAG